jgi:phosphatidyl-myo-inositol dimannoside synthase
MLMITQDFPPAVGGIQTYALELARRLATRCDALHVVCPAAPRSWREDRALGFPVHRVGGSSDALPLLAIPTVMRLVARERIEVVFHVQWQTALVGAVLRASGAIDKLVIAVHGKELLLQPLARHARLQRGYDRLRARLLEQADLVCPVSTFTSELLRTRVTAHARSLVVPNGVDAARLALGDGPAFRARHGLTSASLLVSVGRLVPRKGVDDVIRCMPRLLRQLPALQYVVVGQGPDAARLQALARELGVSSRVRLLGALDDSALRGCYAAADAVVLAARDEPESVEGFGLVLLEAAACGRPTIGTRAGGLAQAIVHGVTGLLVDAGDHEALCAALERVLGTPALARALGEAGRRHAASEGSWERTAERLLAAIASAPSASAVTTQAERLLQERP